MSYPSDLPAVLVPEKQKWHLFTQSMKSVQTVTCKGKSKLFVIQYYNNFAACFSNELNSVNCSSK